MRQYFARTVLPTDMRSADATWWTTNGREYGVAGTQEVSDTTRDPLEVVEDLGFVADSLSDRPRAAGRPQFLSRHRQFHRRERHGAGAAREYVLEAVSEPNSFLV